MDPPRQTGSYNRHQGQGGNYRGGRSNWRGRWNGQGRGRGSGGGRSWRGGGKWRGRFSFGNRGGGPKARGGAGNSQVLLPMPSPNSSQRSFSTESEPNQVTAVTSVANLMNEDGPMKHWRIFLPTEDYSKSSPCIAKIKVASDYLKRTNVANVRGGMKSFKVNLKQALQDEDLKSSWPEFETELLESSEVVQGIFGLAKRQLDLEVNPEDTNTNYQRARFVKLDPVTPIQDIKTKDYGRLVSIRGTVIRASNIRPLCMWLAFECNECHGTQVVYQPCGRFVNPVRCKTKVPDKRCHGRKFRPLRNHDQTITVDLQKVKIQEIIQHESGYVPRTITCELTEDLCDTVLHGDIVSVVGVVKHMTVDGNDRKSGVFMELYIHAMSVSCSKLRVSNHNSAKATAGIEFTYEDYSHIQEIAEMESQIFRFLVHSLSPSIYGHEMVKAGLLLAMFGGSSQANPEASFTVRSDPHVLVVGDPGLGKSQMLHSCASVSPRSVFVTGTTTTNSGLTVAITKDSNQDVSLEAGALVVADQGICCIDEFDKMSSQNQVLLEAMEQQSISVAKSGMICSLPARCSILAAANPVGGHYNRAKTVSENLKMGPAILSRFDLVFILIDKADEEMDGLLSEHIMRLHSKKRKKSENNGTTLLDASFASTSSSTQVFGSNDLLLHRLRKQPNEVLRPLPHSIFRKYIAYAKRYCHPKLSPQACEILQNFYVDLRRKHQHSADYIPITTRQLESMARLAEARAKLELREEVTEQDALEVLEIMQSSMVDIYTDSVGKLDFSRSSNGSGMSSRGAAKKFIMALNKQAEVLGRNKFTVDEMKTLIKACGLVVPSFLNFLESLNNQGFLLKKESNVYQLLTV